MSTNKQTGFVLICKQLVYRINQIINNIHHGKTWLNKLQRFTEVPVTLTKNDLKKTTKVYCIKWLK